MRSILFLSVMNGDAWGGSEEQWFQFAKWMRNKGYRVGVAVFDWEAKKDKLGELERMGCRIFLIPNKGNGILRSWRQQKALGRIPFKDYELVYVNQGGWKDVAHGPFKTLYKKLPAYVLTFHNYQLGAGLPGPKARCLNAWIQDAQLCIAATGEIFKMLEGEYAIHIKNKEVSYSPPTFVTPDLPTPYPAVRDDQPVHFAVLGALDTSRKAQDVLVTVLAGEKWKARNWQLNIYGEGKDQAMLQELIRKNSLENKVFLRGHTRDVKGCLTASHCLIQVTRFDAMPISVIEAMAMARPCIVSEVGDMPRWVKPGYNGFIVQKAEPGMLDEQLEQAWKVRNEWKQMGIHAFETFQRLYPRPFEDKFLQLMELYLATPKK